MGKREIRTTANPNAGSQMTALTGRDHGRLAAAPTVSRSPTPLDRQRARSARGSAWTRRNFSRRSKSSHGSDTIPRAHPRRSREAARQGPAGCPNRATPQDQDSRDRAARFPDCNPCSTSNPLEKSSAQIPESRSGQARPTRESGFPRRPATRLTESVARIKTSRAYEAMVKSLFPRIPEGFPKSTS